MERILIGKRPDLLDEIFRLLKKARWYGTYVEYDREGEIFHIECPGLSLTGPEIMHYVKKELAPKTKKTWKERAEVIGKALCDPEQKREWLALIEEIENTVNKEE